jgi:hypothetical protein
VKCETAAQLSPPSMSAAKPLMPNRSRDFPY